MKYALPNEWSTNDVKFSVVNHWSVKIEDGGVHDLRYCPILRTVVCLNCHSSRIS